MSSCSRPHTQTQKRLSNTGLEVKQSWKLEMKAKHSTLENVCGLLCVQANTINEKENPSQCGHKICHN